MGVCRFGDSGFASIEGSAGFILFGAGIEGW
jgi:hypothetical protein